jgi:hypothetical protein
MDTSSLTGTWNALRKSIIQAQMSSVIILAVALALVATGQFDGESLYVKVFAVVVVVGTGVLSLVSQFAAIREGLAVVSDLAGATSATEKAIAGSAGYLKLTQVVLVLIALATIVVFALAIF